MTRKEAMKQLESLRGHCENMRDDVFLVWEKDCEALDLAITALRAPTRGQAVLCKDCRFWQGNNGNYPHPECRWGHDETPDEDDYCSFAEKLEVN